MNKSFKIAHDLSTSAQALADVLAAIADSEDQEEKDDLSDTANTLLDDIVALVSSLEESR